MNKTMQGKRQNDPHYEKQGKRQNDPHYEKQKIPSTQYIGAYFLQPFLRVRYIKH